MMIEVKKSREDYFEGQTSCSDVEKRQREWKQLWKMELPPKIKIFCWRFTLNSIPTVSVLKSRNMVDTAECKLCGADEDTWYHALLFCTISRCVWAQLDEEVIEVIATLCISDPMHWVSFMCSNVSQADGIRILVTCWAIWQARRKAIFDGIFQSPLSIMAIINRVIDELKIVEGFQRIEKGLSQPRAKSTYWIPPGSGHAR